MVFAVGRSCGAQSSAFASERRTWGGFRVTSSSGFTPPPVIDWNSILTQLNGSVDANGAFVFHSSAGNIFDLINNQNNMNGHGGSGTSNNETNFKSLSSFIGYAGLYMDKTSVLLTYNAKQATELQDIIRATKAEKVVVTSGKLLGIVGTAVGAYEDYTDQDGFTWGDGVKTGIGIVTTLTPYGWAYAVADLATGIITGTTLTDHIGNAIDGK